MENSTLFLILKAVLTPGADSSHLLLYATCYSMRHRTCRTPFLVSWRDCKGSVQVIRPVASPLRAPHLRLDADELLTIVTGS